MTQFGKPVFKPLLIAKQVCVAVGGFTLIFMMLSTVLDIVGRQLNLFHLLGVPELISISVVFVGAMGLGAVTLEKGHLVIDLLAGLYSARFKALLEIIWSILAFVGFACISYLVTMEGIQAAASGEVTQVLLLSPYFYYAPVMVGFAVAAIMALVDVISTVTVMKGSPE